MLKETIIVASNISEAEKLKSLAVFGKKTFNTRYMSTYELALYLLQRSGVVVPHTFIANDDLSALLYQDVRKIPYFSSFTYNDILGLIDTINDLRHYIEGDEDKVILDKLPNDKFVAKNKAVKEFYILFKSTLVNNNLIDELGIIRYALNSTKTFDNIIN